MPEGSACPPWVIVSPGFHRLGGMEKANLALAEALAERGRPLHLVGHTFDPELADRSGVVEHLVTRPAASFLLGERRLDRRGRRVAKQIVGRDPQTRVVVNGGNCGWHDVNWVHFVHHAWTPTHAGAPRWFLAKSKLLSISARSDELKHVPRARVVIANSEMTRGHLIDLLCIPPEKVRTQYLGADPAWGPATDDERAEARASFDVEQDRPLVVFVGALGYDTRKGFDVLLAAWSRLCARTDWDAGLLVAGGGRGSGKWVAEVERLGLEDRVRFLGVTDKVPQLLAAADLLVSPARYEPYGLNVQEALCRGVPAIVSARAGIAERYGPTLRDMVLTDPENVDELCERLLSWQSAREEWHSRVEPFGAALRSYGWEHMARDLIALVEGVETAQHVNGSADLPSRAGEVSR